SFFMSILPFIEQDNIFKKYKGKPGDAIADGMTVKTYCAPNDPSNPGVNSALCSYAANGAVLGNQSGGPGKLAQLTKGKGTSQTIIIMERFAKTKAPNGTHYWPALGENTNNLYLAHLAGNTNCANPLFGLTPEAIDKAAQDNTAHAFDASVLLVGM